MRVGFQFESTKTFATDRLLDQIATRGPSFSDRLKNFLPFTGGEKHFLNPIELQRDVVRLRRFYQLNGFPDVDVAYYKSEYYPAKNRFRLIFTINEGRHIRLSELNIVDTNGKKILDHETSAPFEVKSLEIGDRFSEIERTRVREEVLSWYHNNGFAFAHILDSVEDHGDPYSIKHTLVVTPGPLASVDTIEVEGNRIVSKRVIRRELPLESGDTFASRRLERGQRELNSMNLFRTALVDVPPQPIDSTVTVRVRVREGRPRLVTYQAGYGRQTGISFESDWTHRNFLGDARIASVGIVANTGYQAKTEDRVAPRLFRGSFSVRQPYLFSTRLSGSLTLFAQFERDAELPESDNTLGINERELGLDAALFYELLPYRSITVQYQWSRALQFGDADSNSGSDRDIFNRGSLTMSALFGKTTDYLRGGTGFLVRPFVEMAAPSLGSDVHYTKTGIESSGYSPVTRHIGIWGRFFVGRLWPRGSSTNQSDPQVENRFDQIRFYAGGSTDLRGWTANLAGPKVVRVDVDQSDSLFVYEAVGGLSKVAAEFEFRFPFPGLSEAWGTALFFGAANVSEGSLQFKKFLTSAGAGIRFRTVVGLLRLDLAYKLNPDTEDVRRAEEFYRLGTDAATKNSRRWALHLSIGQTF